MADEQRDTGISGMNVFGADQMTDRRVQAKALLQKKVKSIQHARTEKAADFREYQEHLQKLLEADPRYIEMVNLLNHPDMLAISESLEEHIKAYLNSWGPELSIDDILDGKVETRISSFKSSCLEGGIDVKTSISRLQIYLHPTVDISQLNVEDIIARQLAVGMSLVVQCISKQRGRPCWHVSIDVKWNTATNGMSMSYFDSSVDISSQPLSRLDELFEKVATTLSNTPRLWASEEREWSAFRSKHYEAIQAFAVMSKGSTIGKKLGSYFHITELWALGIEDEIKLVITQIHNQFQQTELLRQIANNTSGSARFSAASYGVSSANAVALSGISEQIEQLSRRVEQLANR